MIVLFSMLLPVLTSWTTYCATVAGITEDFASFNTTNTTDLFEKVAGSVVAMIIMVILIFVTSRICIDIAFVVYFEFFNDITVIDIETEAVSIANILTLAKYSISHVGFLGAYGLFYLGAQFHILGAHYIYPGFGIPVAQAFVNFVSVVSLSLLTLLQVYTLYYVKKMTRDIVSDRKEGEYFAWRNQYEKIFWLTFLNCCAVVVVSLILYSFLVYDESKLKHSIPFFTYSFILLYSGALFLGVIEGCSLTFFSLKKLCFDKYRDNFERETFGLYLWRFAIIIHTLICLGYQLLVMINVILTVKSYNFSTLLPLVGLIIPQFGLVTSNLLSSFAVTYCWDFIEKLKEYCFFQPKELSSDEYEVDQMESTM
jgi:hypothetical protein